ncbi:MAG: hypothetical protein BWK78_04800 [Thiotrichaceae bacterium IS1]|nr:MAG: hypothetical protein BWK78_04800 [Thiotrichaceae bacterium IS1]
MVADQLSLIDTDTLSYILKRKEPAYQNSLHYLQKFGGLKISCLSYYECRWGYQAIGATKKLQVFQALLQITEVFYLNPAILEKASEVYGVLKQAGWPTGEFDLLIGTTALVNGLIMVTNNEKHYQPLIDYFGLVVENWM